MENNKAPNTVLMIEPIMFGFNEDAFATNKFQEKIDGLSEEDIQEKALAEFNNFVSLLESAKVNVLVQKDTPSPHTPDSIFPNNWVSTHSNGFLITYPMEPLNRRLERRNGIVNLLQTTYNYSAHVSLEKSEHENQFLEGTGSLVFDHQNKFVYAAISPRTNEGLVKKVADLLGYSPITFRAYGKTGELIYHTNVMLCIGETFAVVGTDTIDLKDKAGVLEALRKNKEIIELNNDQVYNSFAGNMLQLRNTDDETVIVMSKAARNSLTKEQLDQLQKHNKHIVSPDLETIEKIGGGSARCMLAEVYPVIL